MCRKSLALFFALIVVGLLSGQGFVDAQAGPVNHEQYCSSSQGVATELELQPEMKTAVCGAASAAGSVMITVANGAALRAMLPLSMDSLRLTDAIDNLVVLVNDKASHRLCTKMHIVPAQCVLDSHHRSRFSVSHDSKDMKFGGAEFNKLVWRKPELAYDLMQLGFAVLLVDSDILFFKNPLELVENLPIRDVYFQREGYNSSDLRAPWVNIGFYYLRPTSSSIKFVHEHLGSNTSRWDQQLMNDAIKRLGQPNNSQWLAWDLLPEDSNFNWCNRRGITKVVAEAEMQIVKDLTELGWWDSIVFVHAACCARPLKEFYMVAALKASQSRPAVTYL